MIPTALSHREIMCLQRWALNKRVIEAGALLGASTVALSHVANSVISIDKHEGYTGPSLKPYMNNIWLYGNANVLPVVGDVLHHLQRYHGQFGFIDLTGDDLLTRIALNLIQCPVVAVHDHQRPNCRVSNVLRDYEVLEVVDTLAIVKHKTYSLGDK